MHQDRNAAMSRAQALNDANSASTYAEYERAQRLRALEDAWIIAETLAIVNAAQRSALSGLVDRRVA